VYSENNTEDIIKQRMIGNIPSDIDSSEGSFIYDAIAPVGTEMAQAYISLDEVLNMVFAINAAENGYSSYLDLKCSEFGMTRKSGVNATGQVTFSGAETTPIPSGSLIQTAGGLQYVTTAGAVITGGVATVNVQASDIGSDYNIPAGIITQIPVSIPGITAVNNINPITGGAEVESDDALLQRLLLQVQNPATSGNSAHYIQWALSVAGIGAATVFPTWSGAGTVKICAVDSNMQPLSSALLTALSNYIESQRPIGATVSYESATALPINVVANVTRNTAYSQAQIVTAFTNAFVNYLKGIALKQNYVSYAIIGSLLLATPGVTDYSGLTINGGSVNITIGTEQVATLGTVTVNAP